LQNTIRKRTHHGITRRALETGWIAGRNVQLTSRWAIADVGRVRDFAKELVRLQPDVILAQGTPSVAALVQETRSIPIVFVQLNDPIGSGLVQGLAKPGGHLTGFTISRRSAKNGWRCLSRWHPT
jgi:putative ABC transport system substrate-binding protein